MCVCKFSDHVFEYIAIVAVWLHALFLKLPLWQSMVPVHLVVSMSQLSSWTVFLGRSCDAIARLHSKWRMCHWKIPFEKSHFATAPCPVSRPHLFPGCGCVHEPLLIAVKCIVSVFRCCAVRSPRRPFEMSHCCSVPCAVSGRNQISVQRAQGRPARRHHRCCAGVVRDPDALLARPGGKLSLSSRGQATVNFCFA